ncbi:helix-turn-helix domain-containing protein [Paracidovorax citrulli]
MLYPKAGGLLHISQEELGELAGLSRSTTNMAIMRLKKLGLLHSEYVGIVVLDVERLKAFVHASTTDAADEVGKAP